MFDSYRNKYDNVRMKREDGILEVALHQWAGRSWLVATSILGLPSLPPSLSFERHAIPSCRG